MSYATVAELREYLPQVPASKEQRVTVTGSPTNGTFTLTYEGVASAAIAYNALASEVKTKLNAVSTINNAVESVAGPAGGPWVVTFNGATGDNASPLVLGTNSLTGGTAPSVTIANARDALLQKVLNRATRIVRTVIGYDFASAAAGSEIVYGDGTIYLVPPSFVDGSVTLVTTISGLSVPDYIEQDGILIAVDADGVIPDRGIYDAWRGAFIPYGWREGVPYTVAATYGYSAVPDDVVECCLEVAARLWRGIGSGFSDVIGVEGGGAVGYNGAFPKLVREILSEYIEKTNPGVW